MSRRHLVVVAAIVAGLGLPEASASEPATVDPQVQVTAERDVYHVTARFSVTQPAATAMAVLTDYERIPRFMPAVTSSTVLERGAGHAVVAQEATARMLMFSKRVHLVLDIDEDGATIRFRDRCGTSFESYAGAWTVSPTDGLVEIVYVLDASPAFEVPEFLLKRLLRRDAMRMIEQLRAEIAARAGDR